MWPYDQNLITLVFFEKTYHNFHFIWIWPEKPIFELALVQASRFDLNILQKCGKRVKTKSQKVLRAKPYVWKNYRGKLVGGRFVPPPYWIWLRSFVIQETFPAHKKEISLKYLITIIKEILKNQFLCNLWLAWSKRMYHFVFFIINLSRPDPGRRKKIDWNFYLNLIFWNGRGGKG